MKLSIFLDLDRTLYRTDLGTQLIWQEVERLNEAVSAQEEQARLSDFYLQNDDLYAYDFSSHLRAIGLDVERVYQQLESSDFADGRLEYEGAQDLVKWIQARGEAKVLTYGVDDFQRLKARLCPSLRGVDIITTLKPKGKFFREADLRGRVWMVDDKLIGGELPEGVEFIWILNEGRLAGISGYHSAGSLLEVQKVIEDSLRVPHK